MLLFWRFEKEKLFLDSLCFQAIETLFLQQRFSHGQKEQNSVCAYR